MTVGEAYRKTKDILTEAGFEAPAFEALCLTEKVFGFNRLALITKGEETVASEEKLAVLAELTEKRLITNRCSISLESGALWELTCLWARVFLFREMTQR